MPGTLLQGRRTGTNPKTIIPINSARYDPVLGTVTLRLLQRLKQGRAYELTIISKPPKGPTDANGVHLYGPGTIQPGADIVLTFD